MAPRSSSPPETVRTEADLLARLLGLYDQERQIYIRVLDLSRQQGAIIAQGGPLSRVQAVLEQKNACLEAVRRLEAAEQRHKREWEQGRSRWSATGKARLHAALQAVGALIEDILRCEERNDMQLIEQAKEF
jgi:hypothetical protein